MASLFFSCEVVSETKKKHLVEKHDSELALLMRDIYHDVLQVKKELKQDNFLLTEDFIIKLKRIHDAIPTDKTVKTDRFMAFSNTLLIEANKLKKSNTKGQFNNLINSCVNCHTVYCPGPVKTIKKLKL